MKLNVTVFGQNLQKMMEEINKGIEVSREPPKPVTNQDKPLPEREQRSFEQRSLLSGKESP